MERQNNIRERELEYSVEKFNASLQITQDQMNQKERQMEIDAETARSTNTLAAQVEKYALDRLVAEENTRSTITTTITKDNKVCKDQEECTITSDEPNPRFENDAPEKPKTNL